jgi:hypothetical protein
MKHIFVALVVFLLGSMLFAQEPQINIIPKPQSIEPGTGSFTLSASTKIVARLEMKS